MTLLWTLTSYNTKSRCMIPSQQLNLTSTVIYIHTVVAVAGSMPWKLASRQQLNLCSLARPVPCI